jgi:methyl-accepting chemotaxis protein
MKAGRLVATADTAKYGERSMNMLRNMTIGRRLAMCFGFLLTALCVNWGLGVVGLNRISASAERVVTVDFARSQAAHALERHAQATLVGVLKSLQKSEQVPHTEVQRQVANGIAGMDKAISELRTLSTSSEDAAGLDRLDAERKGFVAAATRVMEFAETGKVVQGESAVHQRLDPRYTGLKKEVSALVEKNAAQVAQSTSSQGTAIALARDMTLGIGIVCVVIAALLAYWVMRSLTEPIGRAVRVAQRISEGQLDGEIEVDGKDEVGQLFGALAAMQTQLRSMMAEVAGSAEAVSASATSFAAAAGESIARARLRSEVTSSTATAVEQMTVSISQVAEHAQAAAAMVEKSSTLAREGEAIVRAASSEMNSIAQSVQHGSALVETLNRRSGEISSIVRVIKDIADQTNLLALNAAIEAARAGEQGRGFAVVADEVRKLAERTGSATSEISTMIEAIQRETTSVVETMQSGGDKVTQGVRLADDAAAALEKINTQVIEAAQSVNAIAQATREQQSSSTEIARNVERIAQMTEDGSASADHNAESAAQLEQSASTLQTHVRRFKV